METKSKKVVSLESYRELESTCRLWMAACSARDERVQELERECRALNQRVARLTRQAHRQDPIHRASKQARFAR